MRCYVPCMCLHREEATSELCGVPAWGSVSEMTKGQLELAK